MADRGGTLLVVRDVDGHVFGGFASTPWHVSPHYFGTGECFLFSASPAFRCWPWTGAPLPPSPLASRPSPLAFRPSLLDPILAPSAPAPPPSPVAPSGRDPPRDPSCPHPPPPCAGANSHFQLGFADSIAFGGGGQFAIWLDEAFEYGSSGRCETFGNEPLSASADFKVSRVEMWGFEYSARSPTLMAQAGLESPTGFSGCEDVQQLRRADSATDVTTYGFAQIAGIMRSACRSQVAGRMRPA